MSMLRRDMKILRCHRCRIEKPASAYYASNLSTCMECKKAQVQDYKHRTNYNANYRKKNQP